MSAGLVALVDDITALDTLAAATLDDAAAQASKAVARPEAKRQASSSMTPAGRWRGARAAPNAHSDARSCRAAWPGEWHRIGSW